MSNPHNGVDHGDHDDQSTKDKFKHPFQELRDKLEGTHLQNFKIGLTHQKYVALADLS